MTRSLVRFRKFQYPELRFYFCETFLSSPLIPLLYLVLSITVSPFPLPCLLLFFLLPFNSSNLPFFIFCLSIFEHKSYYACHKDIFHVCVNVYIFAYL